ncbi:16S rRNA (uracil1498-N3)-methyltransferase [Muriicola jejuensis]|uniref:Ribosomal RNA small subunit methyltransferase E n=1 Tax=Muriicola jejuensis TaxID=504488 RepID=A0A6P0UE71_9FLAO|nr:16S rRNA (uracil(1498)-N(3))-methyltransferase [Muriicola jejuensis]NER11571.1 16S rRNA (uracil(1498)-N(3))-methyltransferase [Muriicola jejuensis]SMP19636.1 16S rRNA (uracil1498-N3)-methyltransferase [Muriicola jejuensis]
MQLFYNPEISEETKEFDLGPEESKHLQKVLRKKEGDTFHITNGKGWLFEARLEKISPKSIRAMVLSSEKRHRKMHSLHMAVAPTKSNDRFEWFLEKATEIGIDEITPIICKRSERKTLKIERLQKVIQEAMKQSLRTYLPVLHPPVSLEEFLQTPHPSLRFIAHCHEEEKMELKRRIAPDKRITVLVGPEGDFTEEEVDMAYDKGFLPVSLGESRLRTETAAIYACTAVAVFNSR